jgi:hypothetical protein
MKLLNVGCEDTFHPRSPGCIMRGLRAGVIRIVVPDLERVAREYLESLERAGARR